MKVPRLSIQLGVHLLILFAIYLPQSSTKLVKLVPVKCRGRVVTNSETFNAVFLGKSKIDILESEGEDIQDITVCDVIPIPIQKQQIYDSHVSSISLPRDGQQYQVDRQKCISALSAILGRDGGFFDNLPFAWRSNVNARKEIYSFLSGGEGLTLEGDSISLSNVNVIESLKRPEEALIVCLKHILGCSLVGIILEVKDELGKDSVSLGAAVVLAQPEAISEYTVSTTNALLPDFSDLSTAPACVINCKLDEIVFLSLASGMPIYLPTPLFGGAAVDVTLLKEEIDFVMQYSAPFKPKSSSELQLPAWEIFDPNRFLSMSTLQKREVLRYSGLSELPRPREGTKALDAVLLDLMDDAVRSEYLRLREQKSPSYKREKSTVNPDSTSRQSLLQAMAEALESGDITAAEVFRDRFTLLTMLEADPTQTRGSYQEYLDQDEWYMMERRKAMGIPLSKTPTTKKSNP